MGPSASRLFDEEIPVRARVHTINGLSAHADQRELSTWLARIGGVTTTILVHGEESAMRAFAASSAARASRCRDWHEQLEF